MSEAVEIKEPKAVKNRTYACCPICSKTLVQADYIRNGIIKCENCRRRVYVDISDNGVIVKVVNKSE